MNWIRQKLAPSTIIASIVAVCGAWAQQARASTLSALNGVGIHTGNDLKPLSPVIGGEYTFNMSSKLELGGSYDHAFLRYKNGESGSSRFYGLVARLQIPGLTRTFCDAKLGANQKTAGDNSSGLAPAAAVGVGYRFEMGNRVELRPRAGIRYLRNAGSPNESVGSGLMADIGMQFSFHF